MSPTPAPLTPRSFLAGLSHLSEIDPALAQVVETLGPPPLWSRQPGFPTLVHIILEQQVSLASARAAFDRLKQATLQITPDSFLRLTDSELRSIGFSRQKARYGRALSFAVREGRLDLDGLHRLDDAAVRQELTKITGIGRWTADIYLLMALLRPDVWPSGDLALAKAVQELYSLSDRPSSVELEAFAVRWKPWRAVAARILWHHYLAKKLSEK